MEYKTRGIEQSRDGDNPSEPHHGRKACADEQGSGSHKKKAGYVQGDIDVLAVTLFASRLALGRRLRVVLNGSGRGLRRRRRRCLDGYACRKGLGRSRRQRRDSAKGDAGVNETGTSVTGTAASAGTPPGAAVVRPADGTSESGCDGSPRPVSCPAAWSLATASSHPWR